MRFLLLIALFSWTACNQSEKDSNTVSNKDTVIINQENGSIISDSVNSILDGDSIVYIMDSMKIWSSDTSNILSESTILSLEGQVMDNLKWQWKQIWYLNNDPHTALYRWYVYRCIEKWYTGRSVGSSDDESFAFLLQGQPSWDARKWYTKYKNAVGHRLFWITALKSSDIGNPNWPLVRNLLKHLKEHQPQNLISANDFIQRRDTIGAMLSLLYFYDWNHAFDQSDMLRASYRVQPHLLWPGVESLANSIPR